MLLLPVSLGWINGQTQDFDGTTPTTVIPAPENPNYANDVAGAGGCTQSGVLPMGQGRPYPVTLPMFPFIPRITLITEIGVGRQFLTG
jgi:hypothetical protein